MHTLLYLLLFNLFSPLLVEYTLYKLVILLLFFAGFEIQHVAQLVQQDLGTQKFEVYTVLLSFNFQKPQRAYSTISQVFQIIQHQHLKNLNSNSEAKFELFKIFEILKVAPKSKKRISNKF